MSDTHFHEMTNRAIENTANRIVEQLQKSEHLFLRRAVEQQEDSFMFHLQQLSPMSIQVYLLVEQQLPDMFAVIGGSYEIGQGTDDERYAAYLDSEARLNQAMALDSVLSAQWQVVSDYADQDGLSGAMWGVACRLAQRNLLKQSAG